MTQMTSQNDELAVYTQDTIPPLPDIDYAQRVIMNVQLIDIMGLHGALTLCLKHPDIGQHARKQFERLRAEFGQVLIMEGFPKEYLDAWFEA